MTNVSFNPSQLTRPVNDDFLLEKDFDDKLVEHDGSFYQEDEFMIFEVDGNEVVIIYNLCVDGYTTYDGGDYFTPPCASVCVNNQDVEVTDVTINDYSINLNTGMTKIFAKIVDKNL